MTDVSGPILPTPARGRFRRTRWLFKDRRRNASLVAVLILLAGVTTGCIVWFRNPALQQTVAAAGRWPQSTAAMRKPGRLRVLFIGNSFTQYNGGLALILEQLAKSGKIAPSPVFDQDTVFGATLAQLHDYSTAPAVIKQGNWDYVVLQDYSLAAMKYRREMDTYGKIFSDETRGVGGTPVFFMTWARKNDPGSQGEIAAAYSDVAAANRAPVAPAGLAWQNSLAGRPSLVLHNRDKKHPTPAGSYLNGCVFYSIFFNKSPHGLTRRIVEGTNVYIDLNAGDAVYLQDTAWKTVQAAGKLAATRPATGPVH